MKSLTAPTDRHTLRTGSKSPYLRINAKEVTLKKPFSLRIQGLRSALAPAVIVATCLVLAWALSLLSASVGTDWNNRLNDAFFRVRYALKGPEQIIPSVAHVDLTDSMVEELGMKGGDRRDFARLVGVLAKAGVSSIIFDIIFPERGARPGTRRS